MHCHAQCAAELSETVGQRLWDATYRARPRVLLCETHSGAVIVLVAARGSADKAAGRHQLRHVDAVEVVAAGAPAERACMRSNQGSSSEQCWESLTALAYDADADTPHNNTSGFIMRRVTWPADSSKTLPYRSAAFLRAIASVLRCSCALTNAVDVVAACPAAEGAGEAGLVGNGLVVPAGPAAHQRRVVELLRLRVTRSEKAFWLDFKDRACIFNASLSEALSGCVNCKTCSD